jgi:deazaflavin-dependent oxidoreductase (nitroreductase family)
MSAFMKIGNFFIRLILSSPLHSTMSKNTLLIHFTGRKSGKLYTTPVNYTQEGGSIHITSQRDRVWWRNLIRNSSVSLTLCGELVNGNATIHESQEAVVAGLERFLRPAPQLARYYQIKVAEDGSLDRDDLVRSAQGKVVIEISLV